MYFSVSDLINESHCFSIHPTLFFIKQNDFPVACDFLMFCRGASQGYILCHNTLYMFMLLRFVFISQCLRLNKLLIFSHKSNEKLICIFCLWHSKSTSVLRYENNCNLSLSYKKKIAELFIRCTSKEKPLKLWR